MIEVSTGIRELLVEKTRARVGERIGPRSQSSVRVTMADVEPVPVTCDVSFCAPGCHPKQVRDLPSGVGATMLDLERAIGLAGYAYLLIPDGRPARRIDHHAHLDVNRP